MTVSQEVFSERATRSQNGLFARPSALERGQNNFLNYASQLQATLARSQIPKASK
jgi:hypothetical protein